MRGVGAGGGQERASWRHLPAASALARAVPWSILPDITRERAELVIAARTSPPAFTAPA